MQGQVLEPRSSSISSSARDTETRMCIMPGMDVAHLALALELMQELGVGWVRTWPWQ